MKGIETTRTFAYRAVKGAVRNAKDAHPEWEIDRRFEQAIAKRAAGTLLARVTLAERTPSRRRRPDTLRISGQPPAPKCATSAWDSERPARMYRRSPLAELHAELGIRAKHAFMAGHDEQHAAFVEALRLVGAKMKGRVRIPKDIPAECRSREESK